MAYLAEQGEDLTGARLESDLQRFSNPAEREWLLREDPTFGWHVLCNLARNCEAQGRETPFWLESMLAEAPAGQPVVFGLD